MLNMLQSKKIDTTHDKNSLDYLPIAQPVRPTKRRWCVSMKCCYRLMCWACFIWLLFSLFVYYPMFIEMGNQTLGFRIDGTFKILQVADIHFGNGKGDPCYQLTDEEKQYPCDSFNSTDFIRKVYEIEQPDLVVYTGDNIDGGASNAIVSMNMAFNLVNKGPWAAVIGNHDGESSLTRYQVMRYLMTLPNNIIQIGPPYVHGYGNYLVHLNDGYSNTFTLYFLDSGSYSDIKSIPGYAKIHLSQIDWYNRQSHREIPAIAFFHIPLPEYETCKLKNMTGSHYDKVGSSQINSGFFSQVISDHNEIKMINVGHDHINDYCGSCYGVYLCYGGGVGYKTYGKTGWDRRLRVIEISEWGKKIKTWKRLHNKDISTIDIQTIQ